jgi:FlaA1/EpsC-like NDP-sugar epimerase
MYDKGFFKDRRILITGGVGTVGRALLDKLLACSPREVRVLDNAETGLFMLAEELRDQAGLNCFLGDVRDPVKLESVMAGLDMVFHAAAFKHVVLSEYNPFEAVQTNILGVQNIVQQAIRAGVKRVIFTSSDKAANPTNVMGTSKLMGERLVTAANIVSSDPDRVFSSTRFGNVLGSRGSVVP